MGLRALIIEDDHALQLFYQRVLERLDFEVMQARDGVEAIELLSNNPPPHFIILDILLPEIGGLDVLSFMAQRPELAESHVLIATAGQEYEKYIGIMPSSEFLLKPLLPTKLLQIAQRVKDGQKA